MDQNKRILLMMVHSGTMSRKYEEPGICCIASYLRENGYDVLLMSEDEKLVDYVKIKEYRPFMVGMTAYRSSEPAVLRVGEKIKEELPETFVCIGGYSPSFRGTEILNQNPSIDFVIKGEGELPLLNLISELQNGRNLKDVRGLYFRDNGSIVQNENQGLIKDLNTLPRMARDLLAEKKYNIAMISGSRGCTGNCSFCVTKSFYRSWRGRDVKDVVDEMEHIVKTYQINVFYFVDCSFENPGLSYQRVYETTSEIVKRNLDIYYLTFFKADFQRKADDKLMELLKESGLFVAILGIEAANEQCLNVYKKRATPEDNHKAVELFTNHGIHVEIGFIMFNPYSTFDGLRKNIDFLEKYEFSCSIDYFASLYAMFEGCPLNQKIIDDKLTEGEGVGVYGYRFVDPRVQTLAHYIFDYIQKTNIETNGTFMRLRTNLAVLEYLKRIYAKNKPIYDLILEADPLYREAKLDMNSRFSNWFRQVLDIAEEEWDQEKANGITQEMISAGYMEDICKKVEHKKNILHIKLSRIGMDIAKIPFFEHL